MTAMDGPARSRSAERIACAAGAALLVLLGCAAAGAQTRALTPVTDAMLQNPDPADWLNWRRTLDGWGYSPLDQIDRENVDQLQLVWGWQTGPGLNQAAPLVHDGVMFIPSPRSVVQAVDAVTGDRIWEYSRQLGAASEYLDSVGGGMRTRSVAIYGDKVFVNTSDAHIVALDAATGEVVWDHTVADYRLGYRYTSGPIVVNGNVVSGMTGCQNYKNDVCFISAHDPETGEQVWRTSTIARPGEPGGDTWGDLPLTFRAGADSWIPGSYDPETNLTFWSTSQAKPWARISRKTDGDALYTNSVLALDPATGALEWYFQFVPGETHDLDDVFESVLIDHRGRRSLFKMGKHGILWELDRATGAFVAAHDLGYQNVLDVDPRHRRRDLPAGDDPGGGRRARLLPRLRRHPQLARERLPPGDAVAVHPHPPHLRAGHVHRARAGRGQQLLRRPRLVLAGKPGAPGQRRARRPSHRDGHRHGRDRLAALDGDASGRGGPDHRGRPGRERRHEPQPVHPRRRDRRGAVPDAPARLGAGVSRSPTPSAAGSTWPPRSAAAGPTRCTCSRYHERALAAR